MNFKAIDQRLEGKTVLRQCQLTQLYLLDVFVEICERHNFQYYLDYGTLIGAMRHDGVIPWDDDIDVTMPIDDYKKFLALPVSEFPQKVHLELPWKNPDAFQGVARLRDCCSFYSEWYTKVSSPCGIFIDIFALDKFPKLSSKFSNKLMRAYECALFCEQAHRTKPNTSIFYMPYHFFMCLAWKGACAWIYAFYLILRLVRPTVLNQKFGSIGFSVGGVEPSVVFPLKKHIFEGKEYNVPNDSDRYLTLMYGDWRTPPPPDRRKGKHNTLIVPTRGVEHEWTNV